MRLSARYARSISSECQRETRKKRALGRYEHSVYRKTVGDTFYMLLHITGCLCYNVISSRTSLSGKVYVGND